jgi:hypothetical protein
VLSRSRTSSEEIDPFHTVDGKQAPTRQTILSLALPLLIMPEKQSLHLCWCDLVLLGSNLASLGFEQRNVPFAAVHAICTSIHAHVGRTPQERTTPNIR